VTCPDCHRETGHYARHAADNPQCIRSLGDPCPQRTALVGGMKCSLTRGHAGLCAPYVMAMRAT
jgi:hypothetical protein